MQCIIMENTLIKFPTSSNVFCILSIFSDILNFYFHFSPICLLITAITSLLSIAITTGSFNDTISSAPALACWSANSFPNMSLCPGTHWICILFRFSPICLICCSIELMICVLCFFHDCTIWWDMIFLCQKNGSLIICEHMNDSVFDLAYISNEL